MPNLIESYASPNRDESQGEDSRTMYKRFKARLEPASPIELLMFCGVVISIILTLVVR